MREFQALLRHDLAAERAELEAQARGSCDFFLEHAGTSQLPLRTEEDFVPEDSPEVEWHHQRLAEFARQGAATTGIS